MLILVLFLGINLVIGLFSSRRVTSLQDYAIGRKDFSTATLTASIVVSWVGSWYVFETLGHTYTDGLYFIIAITGACTCLVIVGLLAVRMQEFLKNISVAEAMGGIYGKTAQTITAISGVLSVLTIVAMEFHVISRIISLIFNTESIWTPVIAAVVVIVYSVSGGIRAVTFTDVIQFFTFGTFIPILALVIWNQLKDPNQVITLLNTHPNFSWSHVIGWDPKFLDALAMMLWFLIPAMDPVIFQRISMARDIQQIKESFSYAGLISLVVCLFLAWIAILLLANNPNLEADKLVEHIIYNYTSAGLRGLIGIGVLALAMSTADSYLNASAVLLTNDIAKPLGIKFKNEVLAARVFCGLSGIFALLIALQFKGILSLLQFANSLYMPVVTVPLLMAIFGFRSSTLAVLIGMAGGLGTTLGWPFIIKESHGILPGIMANLIGLLGSHYILKQPGGWVGIREPEPLLEARENRRKAWNQFKKDFKEFSLVQYLQKSLPNQDYLLTIFGIYVIAATYASFYTVPEEIQANYAKLYHIIGQSVLFISTGLLTYPLWPPIFKNKWFITWAWPLSVFYVLFAVGTWLVLMSGFHTFQTMIFLLNVVMGFLLLPWHLVSIMVIIGVTTATYIFKIYAQVPILPDDFGTLRFKILYGLLLASNFIALFKYQQAQGKLVSHNQALNILQAKRTINLREALQHRERFMHTLAINCVEGFNWLYQQSKILWTSFKPTEITSSYKDLINEAVLLLAKQQQASEYLAQTIFPFKNYLRLNVEKVNLANFLNTALENLDKINIQAQPKITLQQLTHYQELEIDPVQIQKLLYNTLQTIQAKNHANKLITLLVKDATLVYEMPFIPNYNKEISAIQFILTTIEQPAKGTTNNHDALETVHIFLPKHIENVPSEENQRIIEAHYGYASCETENKDITQIYIIPVALRKIRPTIIDESKKVLDEVV
ncbi:sodium:solute symporter family protein [Candidatus Amoebophilus asiaticus]|nr:sodium:solute symporter family protein [Candidatus Amoebophilus asiaticus]